MALAILFSACVSTTTFAGEPSPPIVTDLRIENDGTTLTSQLIGDDARLQLIVTAKMSDNQSRDWTHRATYSADPTNIVNVGSDGLVTPVANGEVRLTATDATGTTAHTTLVVSRMDEDLPVDFTSQIVPIFTKHGCNGGGCHGKIAGQNGFRLSLLGFTPHEDYDHLVKESRGRRLSMAAPDRSLLLLKATGASPHGGGARFDKDSHEYRLLRRWIATGVPFEKESKDRRTLTSVDVFPKQRRLPTGESQQLSVVATYSDGFEEDVTRAVVYESNDTEMATVTPNGKVSFGSLVGDVAIMIRYQGLVTVFRADLPLGATSHWAETDWPENRNVVDQHVFAKLRSLGIPPSDPSDDATFLRRVTLDIAGRLPTVEEVRAFSADESETNKTKEEKRDALIDRLVDSEEYAENFARKWNTILRNKRSGGELDFRTAAFYQWIRQSLRENKPYDDFVREIVTASGTVASNPPVAWLKQVANANERLEDTAQLFLGQRIQCARCHHHPYEKWSQGDYAHLSAFFSLITSKPGGEPNDPTFVTKIGTATAPHPKTGKQLKPAGLGGEEITVPTHDDPREHLADWMTNVDNPFFARAVVNRYWKHFMGRGLVEPEDDMRVTNPPSNPELLDGIADAFVESGYDLKHLVRLICKSQAYSLASDANSDNLGDERSYSRFYPKRLAAEQLLDALDNVTQSKTTFPKMPPGTRAVGLPDTAFSNYFLSVFGQPDSKTACECERSQEANLAQSLHLLNSEEMQKKLATEKGRAATLAADTARDDETKIRELYLVAFAREPKDSELRSNLEYVSRKENRREAFEDVVWTLVNSKEFLFNH